MKGLVITHKGLEDISALEIKEIINAKSEIRSGVAIFEVKRIDELCTLCYLGRSFSKVLHLLNYFKFRKKEDILKNLEMDLSDLLKNKKFRVRCQRIGNHNFTSKEIENEVGIAIIKKNKSKVDLENPDITLFVYIHDDDCYFGIDYSGIDLSKREYKIFPHPASIKGSIAYSMLRIAEWNEKEVLLDPFCGSGTIPIEAALYANKIPPFYHKKDSFAFNKFVKFDFEKIDKKIGNKANRKLQIFSFDASANSIKNAKMNAKAAGVYKDINFYNADVEWLDTKFEKESVNKIVTDPPQGKKLNNFLLELFHQANYVLEKNGNITLFLKDSKIAKNMEQKNDFFITREIDLLIGNEKATILRFERNR